MSRHLFLLLLFLQCLCLLRLPTCSFAVFTHPGLLHTEADFARMRAMVNTSAQPWIAGWNYLIKNGRSQLGYIPRVAVEVSRPGNVGLFIDGADRAYQTALRWKVSGDERYANQSIRILDAFSSTTKRLLGGVEAFLAAGIHGYQFANAAEIMRTYPKWTNFTIFQQWMLNIFYPLNNQFLTHGVVPGRGDTHYWANWELCNMASMISIGILTDRRDIFDRAIEYALHGPGNGALWRNVYHIHDGNLGQWQESGRDQGHTTLGIALVSPFLEAAWNQGIDLYSYDNYRLLAGIEYISKTNTLDTKVMDWYARDMPFVTYHWAEPHNYDQQVTLSGPWGFTRPCWEVMYNHYVNRLGMWAPFTTIQAEKRRPEDSGGGGDQLGQGTLTATLPAPSVGATPKLTVRLADGVVLNWFGSLYASYYNIYRSSQANTGYIRIVFNHSGLLTTYTDTDMLDGLPNGVYYYKVTGIIDTTKQETPASNVVKINTEPTLQAQYLLTQPTSIPPTITRTYLAFNQQELIYYNITVNDTMLIQDNVGSYDGFAVGNMTYMNDHDTRFDRSIRFNGALRQYIRLPHEMISSLSDFSICVWVKLHSSLSFARIFDFGEHGQERYMYLVMNKDSIQYTITRFWGPAEKKIIVTRPIPWMNWHHVCITQRARVGTLYLNGTAVAVNPDIDYQPFRLGFQNTSNIYLGKSQYAADPYLNGQLYDFRIYHGALSTSHIYILATGQQPGLVPDMSPAELKGTQIMVQTGSLVDNGTVTPLYGFTNMLSWEAVRSSTSNVTSYTLLRSVGCARGSYQYQVVAALLTGTGWNDTNVVNTTYYSYQIKAVNQAGEGNSSQPVIITPLYQPSLYKLQECIDIKPTPTQPAPTQAPTPTPTPTPTPPTTPSPTNTNAPTPSNNLPTDIPTTFAPTTTPTPNPSTSSSTGLNKISNAINMDVSYLTISILSCFIVAFY